MSTGKIKESSLTRAAASVSGATGLSRILGLVREQIMAYYFGAGMATDAFVAAFRIPNLLRDMFAEGALSSAFVPVFKQKMVKESNEEAFRLANIVFTAILLVVGLVVLLGIVAAPAIVYITANGFAANPQKFGLTVDLARVMMFYLLLVSLSALVMGMLNSFGRFAIPAISPALFNLGIVITVIAFYKTFDQPVFTLAIGVIIGGLAQLMIQLPALFKTGYRYRFKFSLLDEGMKRIMRLFAPMMVGLSASRVNILVNTLLASFLMEGALSYLNYSFRLMHLPLGVFAVALGTVTLPKVSEQVAREDYDSLNVTFHQAIGLNFFVVVPSSVFLALMAPQLIALIYQWGAFSELDAVNTSLALLHYSYGLIGFASVRVLVPFFYAFNDSKLPMRASVVTVVVNLLLYYPCIKILDFAGLAAATSLAGLLNAALLFYFLPSKGIQVQSGRILLNLFRVGVAASVAFYTARLLPVSFSYSEIEVVERALQLLIPMALAGVVYYLLCLILRVDEAVRLSKAVLNKVFR